MKYLSIIVPVYNVALYIKACIDGFYQQGIEEDDFEIILINDGSTDNSLQIITDIEKEHTNILILTQKNQGASVSRNQGIIYAQGKYILLVDSDDLLIPNTLSHFLEYAQRHDTDMIQGKFIKLDNVGIKKFPFPTTISPHTMEIPTKDGEAGFIENYCPQESYAVLYLYKKTFLIENGLFFMEHKYFEDIAFTVNCLLRAKRFAALPVLFYIYRQHSNSIMSTMNTTKLYSMNDIIENLYSLLNERHLSNKGMQKLKDSIYASFSVNLWYLSHYRKLYPYRKEIINDLKRKIPNLSFHNSYKQRLVSFCFKYIPSLYISARYYSTRNKY